MRGGILHARAEKRGGPYYTLSCPSCSLPLVAEMNADRPFVVRGADDLEGEPRLLRALRSFLAAPNKPNRARGARDGEPPRPRSSALPQNGFAKPRKRSPGNQEPLRDVPAWTSRERQLLESLELPDSIGRDDLRTRYRRFVRENHPDRFLRFPEPQRIEAERRFVEVSSVYRELLRSIESRARRA